MRPLLLTFEAFGSYLHETVIDFTDLNAHSLFVISGQTGAGKSTIYDAMTYALFGTGNGKGRKDRLDLRNQMAERGQKTKVELQFELKGKTYRVGREYGATGTDVCMLQVKADEGWVDVPVENQRMTAYDKKIEEMIGINAEQFKQIVILPQGEYEEFLTSKSNKKMEILRSIFSTDRIVRVLEVLKAQVRTLEQEIKTYLTAKETIRKQWLEKYQHLPDTQTYLILLTAGALDEQLIEAVEMDVAEMELKLREKQSELEQRKAAMTELEQQLTAIRLHNQKIDQYEQTVKKYGEKCAERTEIEAIRALLHTAIAARELKSIEDPYVQAVDQHAQLSKLLERQQGDLASLTLRESEMNSLGEQNVHLAEKIEGLRARLGAFEQLEPVVQGLEQEQAVIRRLVQSIEQLNNAIPQLESKWNELLEQQNVAQQNVSVIRYILSKIQELEQSRETRQVEQGSAEIKAAFDVVYQEVLDTYTNDLHQMRAQSEVRPEHARERTAALEKIEHELEMQRTTRVTNQTLLENKQADYDKAIQSLSNLLETEQPSIALYHEQLQAIRVELESLKKLHAGNDKQRNEWQLALEKQRSAMEVTQQQFEDKGMFVKESRVVFEAAFADSKFADLPAFEHGKAQISQIDGWNAKVSGFDSALQALEQSLAEQKAALAGSYVKTDVRSLEGALAEVRDGHTQLATVIGSLGEEKKQLQAQVEQYRTNMDASAEKERQLIPAKELREVLEGGTRQVSFENHILIYHFKEILRFANQRLVRMVHNRYQLKLNEDVSKNTEALDLYVFDHQTGQTRSVQTLSGGEKFMASLALGLGATDSIHASRGGIEMNMMFIDEGFGTLDESKLEEAVRVLLEISQGRVIGVISHRTELKEQMPAMIEVSNRDGVSGLRVVVRE